MLTLNEALKAAGLPQRTDEASADKDAMVERVWAKVQKTKDSDNITKADVQKWAKFFLKTNPGQTDADAENFFEWFNN